MDNQKLSPLFLLLFVAFGCIANTFGQTLEVPTRRLMPPALPFAESFERFDDSAEDNVDVEEVMRQTGEELRELLGEQLTSAVVPLTAVPFLSLTRRQPGIVAPRSGVEAALQFGGDDDEDSEEDSDDDDDDDDDDSAGESVEDAQPEAQPTPVAQPQLVPQTQPQSQLQPQPQPQPQAPPPAAAATQSTYNPYRDNFHDQNTDGSYVYGYSLPNGVRRWERGFHSATQQHGLVVEGFYAQPRPAGHGVRYELRCYRADAQGYHPLAVEYLAEPPIVQRFQLPNVSCFNASRQRR
ncbi:uncharacterized protein LOC117576583 [Drosophila albomicans]|uniref:Uncharacterized protein LOC117576583 n=1 Tax=Drosophila albomicans TaxID=7291 RepID=A0A6P8XVN0_DROAB|nr:uncharacterized protein LOC117576583 [Drosophila albomicans]